MGRTRSHWERIYGTKAATDVSWYQPHLVRSLELVMSAAPTPTASIIDIGGGASTLVDDLIAKGYTDLTVLDVADEALSKAKARLGNEAGKVAWVVADVTKWRPARPYDVWHDRAVFHFLTEPAQQDAYLAALTNGTRPGSTVIMATFALEGPEMCSGLPVQRYSAATLAARLGPAFTLTSQADETHKTPWESDQQFVYAVLRRVQDEGIAVPQAR